MPFTKDDALKHKKNLSEKSQIQWARIAESVRKREMKKGKTEEEAAASAIKQANGVVNANSTYSVYKNKQTLDYEPKIVVHQEKAHLVVPVVMMVEGVHSGSLGPIYHPIEELAKYPESWNGIPVVVYHPEKDGEPVSANSPEVIDAMTVGRVYNTSADGKKLKAEVWFDEEKLNKVSANTLSDVNDSKQIEVSLGMYADYEVEEGEWNGETYQMIAHNHRPDHLAILPDQIGACSCADGCGLGVNKDCKKDTSNNEDDNNEDDMNAEETIKKLRPMGYSVNQIGDYKKQGYQELMGLVNTALRKMDKNSSSDGKGYEYNYLEELYDDSLVYSKSTDNGYKMYKQGYQITSGVVELTGDPVEVHKKVEYVVNSLTRGINSNNQKGGQEMADAKDCPKCLEKINALIANSASKFVEADREWLLTQDENTLDKLIPEVVEKVVEKTVEVNKLSAEDQAALAFGKKQMKERKEKMIKGIQDNTEGVWEPETLNAMSEEMLEKVFKSIKKEEPAPVYFGESGFSANTSKEEPLYPAGVKVETK